MQLLVEHFPGSRAGQHHLIVYVSQSIVQITEVLQQLIEEKGSRGKDKISATSEHIEVLKVFPWSKIIVFWLKFYWICSRRSHWKQVSIG